MPLVTYTNVNLKAVDENGIPVSGALFYVYLAGTTTPVTVYSNPALSVAHPTPVVADSSGIFPQCYVQKGEYKLDITTPAGASLPGYPADNILIGEFDTVKFNDVASLLADSSVLGYTGAQVNVAVDDIIEAGGFQYKVAASDATDHHLTTAGGVKLYVEASNGKLNALAFGPTADGTTDDITELNLWADTMRSTRIPGLLIGDYGTTSNLDLSDTRIEAWAIIYPTGDFEAVKWKAAPGNLYQHQACVGSLEVRWASHDWTKDRTAFAVRNSYSSQFDIGWENATRGLWCHGEGVDPSGRGCVYNTFNFSVCYRHNLGVHLSTASSAGWCNANTFKGGRFYGIGDVTGSLYETNAGHIWIDETSTYKPNGNTFDKNWLEWSGTGFMLARMDGLRNVLKPRYCELDNGGTTWMTDNGWGNVIDCTGLPYIIGYDPTQAGSAQRLDASGALEPKILGPQEYLEEGAVGRKYIQNTSSTHPTMLLENTNSTGNVLTVRNSGSGAAPALEIQNPNGVPGVTLSAADRAWLVKGTSSLSVKKHVLWTESVAPADGTWERGDIAFASSPAAGQFIGWVCIADGTPGTWKTFGAISA